MDSENEMILSVGNQHGIPAKPVDNHIGETSVEPEFYGGFLTGVHLEQSVGMFHQGFSGELRTGSPGF